jgi:hypothetical protein
MSGHLDAESFDTMTGVGSAAIVSGRRRCSQSRKSATQTIFLKRFDESEDHKRTASRSTERK